MPLPRTSALATVHPLTSGRQQLSDAELVARIRSGDTRSEEVLYLRFVGYVTNLCLRLLGNREEAEDAAQDTFVDVLEQLSGLREPERLKQWVARIAVHKAHRRFRRRKLLRAMGLWHSTAETVNLLPANPNSTPELAAELEWLSRVLSGLPDDQRAAWVLRHVDGYKLDEVAAMCGCSLATCKRRISAADQVIRAHVELVGGADA
jgi:RNA polymerase sigma-70 factor (ECF subfamily)